MKLFRTKKGMSASKNHAKMRFVSLTGYNYKNYKKFIKAIGENGFLNDDYDPKENYKKLLEEHYARLKRIEESIQRSRLETLNKPNKKKKDMFYLKSGPKLNEPKITKLW